MRKIISFGRLLFRKSKTILMIGVTLSVIIGYRGVFWDSVENRDWSELGRIFQKFSWLSPPKNENEGIQPAIPLANTDCTNLAEMWRPDAHVLPIENNMIRLKDGKEAGSVIFKNNVSRFFTLNLSFRSSLVSGINTLVAFENDDNEFKIAIGDGDFRIVRSYLYDASRILINRSDEPLQFPMNKLEQIDLTINVNEQSHGSKVTGFLRYKDTSGAPRSFELMGIVLPVLGERHFQIRLGLDAHKESDPSISTVEILACRISEISPSHVLERE